MKEGDNMAVTEKIKALLSIKGKKNVETLPLIFGIFPHNLCRTNLIGEAFLQKI